MTTRYPVLCRACVRFDASAGNCAAFPDGIPSSIVEDGGDHRRPVAGDGGVTFQQADGEEAKRAFDNWAQVNLDPPR
jgi:hypothetical protein